MQFNSIQYALFLPVVFALYWTLPHRFRWALILVSSCYFYMSWNPKYIVLIFFTTAVSYLAGLLLEKTQSQTAKKRILGGALIACLGVLFVCKYFNFFSDSLADFFALFAIPLHQVTLKIALPVGISFYTFQTLSYVIDVYRGKVKAEHHFGIYAAFISFFPQLVAGPIERTENLLPQIRQEHYFSYEKASYGARLMLWGFFKKMVVADNLAVYVDRIYDDVYSNHGLSLVLASIFFAVQIYCDFSGYTDIARGTAKLLDVDLMENFRSPYFSTTIKEFWSRWHISLSTWFRDYVYIPLGGNRVGKGKHWRNLMITFLASGIWHGANWTYLIWGGIHGLILVLENALGIKAEKKQGSLVWWIRVFAVFVIACAAFVFFRASGLNEAAYVFSHSLTGISDFHMYLRNGILDLGLTKSSFLLRCALYFIPIGVYDYLSQKTDIPGEVGKCRSLVRYAYAAVLIFAITAFHFFGEATFVYFQF